MNIFLLTILACVAPIQSQIQTRFFRLPLDHFSVTDKRSFDARYYVNENLYRENGPIFIYLQFGNASTQYILEGNMYEIAAKEGGVLISLETRYYGESQTTVDTSLENLQWFTVYQMVADFGRFATFIKEQYFNAPVILWGRSHGSALVTWTRQKYPNIIDGAWGSSATINIVEEDVNYFTNVKETIAQFGGEDCMRIIDDAISTMDAFIRNGNVSLIEGRFKTCEPFGANIDDDISRFLITIELNLGTSISTYANIEEMCSIIKGNSTTENITDNSIERFARWYVDNFQFSRGIECSTASNSEFAKLYQDPTWGGESVKSWMRHTMWLICSQFGMFQTRSGRYSLSFFRRTCASALESDSFLDPLQLLQTITNVKSEFGKLNQTTRLLLTQGELDAYRSLGPSYDLNSQSPVIIIPGERYSSDLGAPDKNKDSVALYDIKIRIQNIVHEWVKLARQKDGEAELIAENCSVIEKVTFYSLIFGLSINSLFLIGCVARFFVQCKRTRGFDHTESSSRFSNQKSDTKHPISPVSLM